MPAAVGQPTNDLKNTRTTAVSFLLLGNEDDSMRQIFKKRAGSTEDGSNKDGSNWRYYANRESTVPYPSFLEETRGTEGGE